MKKLLVGAALATVAAVSLTACGSNSSDPVAEHAKASLAQFWADQAKSQPTNPMFTAQSGTCVANGLVGALGVKELTTLGVLNAQGDAVASSFDTVHPSHADATTIVNTIFGCVDSTKLLDAIKASMTDKPGVSAATKTCLIAALDESTVRTMVIAGMEGATTADGQAAMAPISAKLAVCATAK